MLSQMAQQPWKRLEIKLLQLVEMVVAPDKFKDLLNAFIHKIAYSKLGESKVSA